MAHVHSKATWAKLRAAYRRGEGSYRELGEKFGVPEQTIRKRAAREKWAVQRNETGARAEQKAREKDEADLVEMFSRHRGVATKAIDRLVELLDAKGKKRPGAFAALAIVQALNGAARAERLASGIEPAKPVTPVQQAQRAGADIVVHRNRNPAVPEPAAGT